MTQEIVLRAIGFTELSTFNEFFSVLKGDCPEKGDRKAWGELFAFLNQAEQDGLVEISRSGRQIDCLQLTEAGADLIRSINDSKRQLF